jgi:hypothetical protein
MSIIEQQTIIEPKVEACARAAHEANRAYCLAIGDASQAHWEDAEEWQRESARNGVVVALGGATPEHQHAAWLADKAAAGWKYGPVKDPEKKEHPCFVPYAELPENQKAKDQLYISSVRCMAAALGMTVTYPPLPAVAADGPFPAQAAYPGHTVDWSLAQNSKRDQV